MKIGFHGSFVKAAKRLPAIFARKIYGMKSKSQLGEKFMGAFEETL